MAVCEARTQAALVCRHTRAAEDAASRRAARRDDSDAVVKRALKRVSVRVPLERAEEARAEWIERFPDGFEELLVAGQLELAAYVDGEAPADLNATDVEPGWDERWREFHRPVRVGPFWIGPPWETPAADAVPLVIDPGRAFGTGAHATTRLCVELLAELEPTSLLDVGTGSGVLAIAAAKLGFSPVLGVDVDPAAVEAARTNAAVNAVAIDVREGDATAEPLPRGDVAIANLSLALVEALLPRVEARTVVTSGYLVSDEPRFEPYVRRARRVRDGWAADLLERAE
jgi:ribosomal protein L11 methyltransferase